MIKNVVATADLSSTGSINFNSFARRLVTCCLVIGFSTGMAQASENKLKLKFDFTGGGIRLMAVKIDLTYDQKSYLIKSNWKTRGIASVFSKSVFHLGARGTITPKQTRPVEFQSRVENSRGSKTAHILWQPKNQQKIELVPKLKSHRKASIDKVLKPTFPDPLSALVAVTFSVDDLCRKKIRSFDGRKIFDFTLKYLGKEILRKGDAGVYFGPAHKCQFRQVPIAGYSKKKMKKYHAKPTPAFNIWFAPIKSNSTRKTLFVPVKATGSINWIPMRAVITKATLNGQSITAVH